MDADSKPSKILVLADIQYPLHNGELLKAVERYMADEKWDYLLYLGDAMDMDAISHHALDQGNNLALEGKRLKEDYNGFSEIMRRHKRLVGNKCKIYYFKGNHEENPEHFINKFPTLQGFLEVENNLPFKELEVEVIKARHFLKIGKVYFIHGDIQQGGYTSVAHAKKIVETYNRNVVYGHHHTLQVFTKISPIGIEETHSAFCIPCLANTQPEWAKDKPNAWLNGFAVVLSTPQKFSVIPIVAPRNSFVAPNGKTYH